MSNIININDVAARTKLAVLQTGAWRATRLHKSETRAENYRHNTQAAKVLVRVTDHYALSDLAKLHSAAYSAHKRLTLPTVTDGMRLLPAGREFEHSAQMREFADEHSQIVAKFMADYDQERFDAPARLNGLYDESMWPAHDVVEAKFTFTTRYLPTPVDGTWGDWFSESARAAESEVRDRLTEALTRVRDRCKSDGRLYASVFDAIRELSDLVPDLDLGGEFENVVTAMAPLTALYSDTVRDDGTARQQAADRASSILSMLGGIQ